MNIALVVIFIVLVGVYFGFEEEVQSSCVNAASLADSTPPGNYVAYVYTVLSDSA